MQGESLMPSTTARKRFREAYATTLGPRSDTSEGLGSSGHRPRALHIRRRIRNFDHLTACGNRKGCGQADDIVFRTEG